MIYTLLLEEQQYCIKKKSLWRVTFEVKCLYVYTDSVAYSLRDIFNRKKTAAAAAARRRRKSHRYNTIQHTHTSGPVFL